MMTSRSWLGSAEELSEEAFQRLFAARMVRSVLRYVFEGRPCPSAVELFAGSGSWVTKDMMEGVEKLALVDCSQSLCESLAEGFSSAEVVQADSILEFDQISHLVSEAQFVSMDNPSNVFGTEGVYCEHFDILPRVLEQAVSARLIVFNVNIQPFRVSDFPGWDERRRDFYGPTKNWILGDFITFYLRLAQKHRRQVVEILPIPRRGSFLWFFVLHLDE